MVVVTPGASVLIDCNYTDPSANIVLSFSHALNEPFYNISSNVEEGGHVFMLNEVDINDDGYYMCERQDKYGLSKIVMELFVVEG